MAFLENRQKMKATPPTQANAVPPSYLVRSPYTAYPQQAAVLPQQIPPQQLPVYPAVNQQSSGQAQLGSYTTPYPTLPATPTNIAPVLYNGAPRSVSGPSAAQPG